MSKSFNNDLHISFGRPLLLAAVKLIRNTEELNAVSKHKEAAKVLGATLNVPLSKQTRNKSVHVSVLYLTHISRNYIYLFSIFERKNFNCVVH